MLDCEYYFVQQSKNAITTAKTAKKSRLNEDDAMIEEEADVLPLTDSDSNRFTPLFSAVMVNPPFYDLEELEDVTEEAGSKEEMRTVGGEVAFVAAMIGDSLVLRER